MREHLTGQFTPGTSILHRLDARAKFFGFLILIAATVCTDAWLEIGRASCRERV